MPLRCCDRRRTLTAQDNHVLSGSPFYARPLRSKPHREPPRRQCADRALQLAARARHRADASSCASRTPTSSDPSAEPSRRSTTISAGSGSTGTRGRTSAGSAGRTASPSVCDLYRGTPIDCSSRAMRTTASARPSNWTPSVVRRAHEESRRATQDGAARSPSPRRERASRRGSPPRCDSASRPSAR